MTENGPVDVVERLSMGFIQYQVNEASLLPEECLKFWSKQEQKEVSNVADQANSRFSFLKKFFF